LVYSYKNLTLAIYTTKGKKDDPSKNKYIKFLTLYWMTLTEP